MNYLYSGIATVPERVGRVPTSLEVIAYEVRPYSLILIAFYSLKYPVNSVMLLSGLVLLLSGIYILRLRLRYRGYL